HGSATIEPSDESAKHRYATRSPVAYAMQSPLSTVSLTVKPDRGVPFGSTGATYTISVLDRVVAVVVVGSDVVVELDVVVGAVVDVDETVALESSVLVSRGCGTDGSRTTATATTARITTEHAVAARNKTRRRRR